jgi:hypothetical protein
LVDRHAVDRKGDVITVIEREAAQKILVGFARAAVLRNDQTGRDFKGLARLGI